MEKKFQENQEENENQIKKMNHFAYYNSRNDEKDNRTLEEKKFYLVIPGNNPEIVKNALINYSNLKDSYLDENDDYSFLSFIWKPTQFTLKQQFKIDNINYNRAYPLIVNHIESFRTILTKNGLYKSLKNYYSNNTLALLHQYNENESVPTTFVIEPEFSEEEFSAFTKRFKEISLGNYQNEPIPSKHCIMNMWLVKPANQNQGRGIDTFKKFKEIKEKIYGNEQKNCWIIQKYIEKPLLYEGRKFDIRVWALLLDSVNLFIYKEGYIRTSSEKYSVQSSQNFVHLTNNCLQIHNPNYGNFEEGNTLSFDTFKNYLKSNYQEKCILFEEHIFTRIKDLIIDSILSARSEISIGKKKYSFEFIGYDFLIDEDFRVWLIEANVNPYIGVANHYIKGLLDQMLKDLFEIVFYKTYSSNGISISNNFQLVYCEKGSIFSPSAINSRSAFSKKNLYPPTINSPLIHLEGKTKKKNVFLFRIKVAFIFQIQNLVFISKNHWIL